MVVRLFLLQVVAILAVAPLATHLSNFPNRPQMVPRDRLIHRHCVTGNWPMVRRWMEAFPNCYVGLTPIVTNPDASQARHVATEVPLDRLLLETDAPYFVPHCYRKQVRRAGGVSRGVFSRGGGHELWWVGN